MIDSADFKFTTEEKNLICLYDTGSRISLIDILKEVKPYIDAPEIHAACLSVIAKLERMNDTDYQALNLVPDFMSEVI